MQDLIARRILVSITAAMLVLSLVFAIWRVS